MGKRILIAPFGSLGDLHPYIALALALKQRGHHPVIATFEEYRDTVLGTGIDFATMRPSIAQFGDKTELTRRLISGLRGPAILVKEMFMPHLRASYDDLYRASAHCDLIVTHPVGYAGPLVAQKRGLPWVSTVLAPMSFMSCIDPPLLGPAPWLKSLRALGVAPYRAIFELAKALTVHWENPLKELRAELQLPPAKPAMYEGQYSPYLNLALFSPLLAAPQADWPKHTVVCGAALYDGNPLDAVTQTRLQRFLAAGEAPLVFGLGSSAVVIAGDFWRHAIAAAQALKRRAILLTGAPPETLGALPPTIQAYDYLPYSVVFPHAAAVIHQAGAGTLAQALHAGRPQLIVPVAFDQPDNAARTAALGAARVLPFQKVNTRRLTSELTALLNDADYAERAAAVAQQVNRDAAHYTACAQIEALFDQTIENT